LLVMLCGDYDRRIFAVHGHPLGVMLRLPDQLTETSFGFL